LQGILCGYLIAEESFLKAFFTRRAIIPGGILLHPEIAKSTLELFLNKVRISLESKAIYIEVRNYVSFRSYIDSFESVGFRYQPHLNFHVSTTNADNVFSRFSESKRLQIKTALKAGIVWKETTDYDEIKSYYQCLKRLYKNKIKMPLFPLEFFLKLAELRNGKLLVILNKNKVIGGMACVLLEGETVYEWFVCGDENSEKEFYPSVVATWAGIEYAMKNKFKRFDFMGAGKPDKNYGVREFKSKFGGELVENGRFLYICKPLLYFLGRFVVEKILLRSSSKK
jgi:lipid II:glycine glycyltransferase (peptidoglycan interpeptide bridge formation enzyme)